MNNHIIYLNHFSTLVLFMEMNKLGEDLHIICRYNVKKLKLV